MEESTIKSKLLELDWKHAAYLHYKCQLNPPTVARLNEIMQNQYGERAGFSSAYQWNMGNDITELLELETMPKHGDMPCEVLHQLTGGNAPSPQSWARIQEENLDSTTGNGSTGEHLAQSLFSMVWLTQLRNRVREFFAGTNFTRRDVLGVLALLAIVVIVIALRTTFSDGNEEPPPDRPVDGEGVPPVITQVVVVTPETDFAATNEALQADIVALQQTLEAQPTASTEVVIVEITATPLPLPTDTPGPPPTPLPTNTPEPTNTPRPTPTPVVIEPFEDNFDAGPTDAWKVISGNPVWSNNTLTTDGDSWLEVGDRNWSDYIVEFDAKTKHWLHRINIMAVGVRANGKNNMVAFRWDSGGGNWYVVESGDWAKINNTATSSNGNVWVHYKITVQDNKFEVEVNGENYPPYYNTSYQKGNIVVRLNYGEFDNFNIKPIED